MTADSRFDVWALRDTETGFAPGERFYYSNVGYRTLGYALEAAAGTPYRELLRAASWSRSASSRRSRRSRSTSATGWRSATTGCTTTARLRRTTRSSRRRGSRRGRPTARWPRPPAIWRRSRASARRAGEKLTSGRLLASGHGWSYGYGLERKGSLFGTAARCPASPRRCSATSTPAIAVAALMNGPDEHNATEVVAQFVLDLHRGANPEPPG